MLQRSVVKLVMSTSSHSVCLPTAPTLAVSEAGVPFVLFFTVHAQQSIVASNGPILFSWFIKTLPANIMALNALSYPLVLFLCALQSFRAAF